jgi:MFS transporter, PCFT/HCP family, solute carrier family 46 (folate transporter), member 1
LRHLFRLELVRDLFRASCKRRPNYDRLIIWLTMGSLVMLIFAMRK